MANRSLMRTAARLELGDPIGHAASSGIGIFTDEELNRMVDVVTADISRVLPQTKYHEITVDFLVVDEAWTSDSGVAVTLGNKPIEFGTETVKQSTTTFVRDTDYTMNYGAGTVTMLAAGAMADSTASTISYTKSRIGYDLSALTDLVRVRKVEWHIGNIPQETADFDWWDEILWLRARGGRSQERSADKAHIRVYYGAEHVAPTDSVDGTFPRFLDDVMIKGVIAYALMMASRRFIWGSSEEAESAASILFDIGLARFKAQVALDSLTTTTTGPHDKIATALAVPVVAATGPIALAQVALDALDNNLAEAKASIANAQSRDLLGQADTALTKIAGRADQSSGALLDAEVQWSNQRLWIETDAGVVRPDMQEFIELGDGLINAVNLGAEAAELFRRYALVARDAGQQYADRRRDFLTESERFLGEATALITEATGLAAIMNTQYSEATGFIQVDEILLREAELRLSQANISFQEVDRWLAKGQLFTQEAEGWISEVGAILAQSDRHMSVSRHQKELGDALLLDARERHRDYWDTLLARVQGARRRAQSSTKQYASDDTDVVDDSVSAILPT